MMGLNDIEQKKFMLHQDQLNSRLFKAAQDGDAKALSQALAEGANARAYDSAALAQAAEKGHAECVRRLIPVSDPLAGNSVALSKEAQYGYSECVRLLIPVSDARSSCSLSRAAQRGHADCVRLLIPVSDPLSRGSLALRFAAQNGHVECVALLLPRSDSLAVGPIGVSAAVSSRRRGHMVVARMIDAFIESQAISSGLAKPPQRAVAKISL